MLICRFLKLKTFTHEPDDLTASAIQLDINQNTQICYLLIKHQTISLGQDAVSDQNPLTLRES